MNRRLRRRAIIADINVEEDGAPGWLLYAGNEVAPLCRKASGSYMA
jgi:hypothetical protein